MGSASDFIIENGVVTKYIGPGGPVVIPAGITSIGNGAFYGCYSLKSLTLFKNLTSIGELCILYL